MKKKALITGVTGQDGSFLAEFLLSKNYEVHGIRRRSSQFNTMLIDHLIKDPLSNQTDFFIHYSDMTDPVSVNSVIAEIKPDEIYNLAAQSHVGLSFVMPKYTTEVNAIGTVSLLDCIKSNKLTNVKVYHASTSELYGNQNLKIYDKDSDFKPTSPYAISKLYAHLIVQNYRKAYDMFATNGILFNHESERRGSTFVSRKITKALTKISNGSEEVLILGNLNSQRDWGYAKDYVEGMWLMLQQDQPQDFIIATGESYTVRTFVNECLAYLKIDSVWEGKGIEERCINLKNGKTIVKVDKKYFRPSDVEFLKGDMNETQKILNWKPKVKFKELIKIMIDHDLDSLQN